MNPQARGEATSSLVAEVLHSRGALQLRATGASMLPTLWPGDLLSIQSRRLEDVEVGDLALYTREGRLFIHRVISRIPGQEPQLIARGDCMPRPDPPVRRAELLGIVTGIRRHHAWRAPSRFAPIHRLLGQLLCQWDLLRRAVLRMHSHPADPATELSLVSGKAGA